MKVTCKESVGGMTTECMKYNKNLCVLRDHVSRGKMENALLPSRRSLTGAHRIFFYVRQPFTSPVRHIPLEHIHVLHSILFISTHFRPQLTIPLST